LIAELDALWAEFGLASGRWLETARTKQVLETGWRSRRTSRAEIGRTEIDEPLRS
jgi:hypothetical protein